ADGTARLWDVATHRQITALAGHAGPVGSVAFSPDGKTLAAGSADGTVHLWDLATHHPIGGPLPGGGCSGPRDRKGGGRGPAVAGGGRGRGSGAADGTARLWDVATHRQITALAGHAGPVGSVAFSPDGKTLATGNSNGSVHLWDLATHHPIGGPITGGGFSVA